MAHATAVDLVPRPSQFPYVAAALDAAASGVATNYGPQLNSLLSQVNALMQASCAQGRANEQRNYAGTPSPSNPGPFYPPSGHGHPGGPLQPPKHDCGCGGKCGGGGACKGPSCRPGGEGGCGGRPNCDPCNLPPGRDPPYGFVPPDPGYFPGNPCMPLAPAGIPRGAVPLLFNLAPACYDCACLDPCLYPALVFARNLFDPWQWAAAMQNDSSLVHIDVNAGDAADFNVPPLPILTNTESLFAQEPGQVLPFIAGLIKVDVGWSTDTPAPGAVTIQFYTGPNPTVTDVTEAELEAPGGQFAVAGRAFKLTDFECKDQCYVQPFVKIFGCTPGPIPSNRAVYARVVAGALPGATTITSLSITLIKQGTAQYINNCQDYRIPPVGLQWNKCGMSIDQAYTACKSYGWNG